MRTELSGKSGRLSFDRKVCLLVGCLIALLRFRNVQRCNLLFCGLETYTFSVDLSPSRPVKRSIRGARASNMLGHEQLGSQGVDQSRFVGPAAANAGKTGFKMAWGWINCQTVNSNTNHSTPFGTILKVRTPQARDKPGHRSHQAPDIGKPCVFEAPGA